MNFISLFIIFIILISTFLVFPLFFLGAPFLPSLRKNDDKNLEEILNTLKELNLEGKNFIDLGSGDGRVVIEFAKRGYNAYGVELNPFLFLISLLKIRLEGLKNITIIFANFWKVNLFNFDIIFFFHHGFFNYLFEKKFIKEAKEKSILISCAFPFKNLDLLRRIGDFYIYSKRGCFPQLLDLISNSYLFFVF